MPEIVQYLRKEKKTLYQFLKEMDINPIASQTSWSLKISGMRPVSSEEYARIKKVMGRDVKHRIETTEKIYLE